MCHIAVPTSNSRARLEPTAILTGGRDQSQSGMGLMVVCNGKRSPVIEAEMKHLVETRVHSGGGGHGAEKGTATCPESQYTGTEFPNFLYIGCTMFRYYFPIMALGRYFCAFKPAGELYRTAMQG